MNLNQAGDILNGCLWCENSIKGSIKTQGGGGEDEYLNSLSRAFVFWGALREIRG